jgi:TatD DNase family protein
MEPLKVKHMLFDSHAHLSSPEVFPSVAAVLERGTKAGVKEWMNICTDLDSLEKGIALAKSFSGIFNAGATTPHDVEKEGEASFASFEKAAKEGLLHAIGETGLDYHYLHSNRKTQRDFLIRYLHLAAALNKTVIFHCREAFADLFLITEREYPKKARAVLHCFTGTMEEAEEVCRRGWYLSLSGIVTFKKSEELRRIAARVPPHQLLIETDTPYLAPQSQRGKLNEPAFLVETAQCVAAARGVSLEEIAHLTRQNAMDAFDIKFY